MRITALGLIWTVALTAGCNLSRTEGLSPAPPGTGPRVIFDLDARPFPEIPFPNDLATRPDPSAPTGRRLNVSLVAPTRLESRVRERLDRLDGFSTFAPFTVRFDAPLDVTDLLARHGADLEFSDDAVYLIDLETGSPVPLDIGYGAYPLVLERPDRYFPNDPRASGSNLVFETVDEDLDGDGVLDPGEDTDGDGVLDRPNTIVPGGDPVDDLMTFYESETDTLIVRPLVPLRQQHGYAVVLTDRLIGRDGRPVRSPFAWINHVEQTRSLEPLRALLPGLPGGLDLSAVAFCWSFTTQTVTREMEHLRMGLYGQGPFAWLASQFPPDTALESAYDRPDEAALNPFVIRAADVQGAMRLMAEALFGKHSITDELVGSYDNVEFLVLGRTKVPQLMEALDDVFEIDAASGRARVFEKDLPWMLAIPKERPELGITRPFPVAIYVHGTGGSRMEALGFAGQLARFGIATVGFDVFLHGLVLDPADADLFRLLFSGYGFGPFIDRLLDNRTVDINADGRNDEAGNFWSYDVFRIRDSIRQGALDVMRLVQVLRGFDGQRSWSLDADGDGRPELEGLAGDFDGDGQVDLVGPDGPYFLFGISLGGIVGSVAAALEPAIVAAAPISSGGGLSDVAVRSLQTGVPELVLLPFLGPLLFNRIDPDTGAWDLAQYLADGRFERSVPIHSLPAIPPGTTIEARNLGNGKLHTALVDTQGRFRVGLPADQGDAIEVRGLNPGGGELFRIARFDRPVEWQGLAFAAGDELVALAEGHGVGRQTPDLRRFIQVSQTVLDSGDPVNYAGHYLSDPLYPDYPGQGGLTRLALVLTVGDMNVPISTGITQARAAGLIPFLPGEEDPRFGATPQRVLIDHFVAEGLERLRRFDRPPWNDDRAILLDPDQLSGGADGFGAPTLSAPLRLGFETLDGGQAVVRFFYVSPRGAHGIGPPDPDQPYPLEKHGYNAIARFFVTLGAEWHDEACQADSSCSWIPAAP